MISMSAGNSAGFAKFNLPGLINGRNIYTTGAITHDTTTNSKWYDNRYSNFNTIDKDPIDFVSVGTHILSTWPGAFSNGQYLSGYRIISGTSMASAVTAGVLYVSKGKITKGDMIKLNGITYPLAIWTE